MTDMKDMYRMARFIDSNKYIPPAGISAPHLAIDDCVGQYTAKRHRFLRHKITKRRASRIVSNAVDAGYIEVIGDNSPIHNGHRMQICTGKGMQLISTEWGFRKGLDEQTMQKYPETRKKYEMKYKTRWAFGGVVVGAAVTLAAVVLKAYVSRHR